VLRRCQVNREIVAAESALAKSCSHGDGSPFSHSLQAVDVDLKRGAV
jgi:hypothetical protein